MPRVPTYDSFQASPNVLPGTNFQGAQGAQSANVQDVAGPQAQEMGRSMQQFGGQVGRIALDMAEQANQLRVDDALNKAKEAALKLTYDPQAGFTNLKGINALERPDGKSLEDEYSSTLTKTLQDISAGLGNDMQRQAFSVHSNDILTALRGQAMRHASQEYTAYGMSVAEGVQSTAMRDISLNWNDAGAISSAVTRIQAETYRQAQLSGKSAEWQQARSRDLTSAAHKTALLAALQNNDPAYADAYLRKFSSQMNADDILTVRGHITKDLDLRAAGSAAMDVMGANARKIEPSDADRAFSIALGTESNNQHFAPDGSPTTSPKGAIGIAQVMPDTAPEAAKLAGLPWDEDRYKNDPDYNKALGRAYFDEQLTTNGGDLAKAYAAYNGGPGRLQDAIKKAEKDPAGQPWLTFMPAETQNYVAKNMREFAAGLGGGTRPTIVDLKAELRNDPRLTGNPARLKAAETTLESIYNDQTAAIKQRGEEATDQALRELYANGGRMDALAPAVRAAIPGDKLSAAVTFAEKVAKNGGAIQSAEAWAKVLSLPSSVLAGMTPSDFYNQFRPVLDDEHLEKGYALLNKAHGNQDDKHLEIITTATRIKDAAIGAGLIPATGKPNDSETKAFGRFAQTIDDRVRAFERTDLEGKRKANSQELQKILDTTLLDKAYVPSTLWFDSEKPVALLAPEQMVDAYVKVGDKDIRLSAIPAAQRALIMSKLQSRGLPVTEQAVASLWDAAGRPK